MNRLGTLQRYGVALAFGSDTPVTPLAGWETVRAAAQHAQPAERMAPWSAFDAATRGAHRAARDDAAGTLTPASRASLAVWDCEGELALGDLPPLEPEVDLPTCVLTVAAGETIYDPGVVGR